MSSTVGLIGVGRMGLPVCSQLVSAGYRVLASDLRAEREEPVRAVGAAWEPQTGAVAEGVDVLMTVLPGSAELGEVMNVALPAMRPGSTWIDLTSSSPLVGRRLWQQAQARAISTLDSPVGGGIEAARTGTLQLFVGGPAETVNRHHRLLTAIGDIHHIGGPGAGYTTKLIVNLLWFAQAQATGEAFVLARRAGIDLDVLRTAVQASAAASEFIARDLDGLLDGNYLPNFGLDRCCEELDAIVELADHLAAPSEVCRSVARAYGRALDRYGPADGELLSVALLEEESGLRLRRDA